MGGGKALEKAFFWPVHVELGSLCNAAQRAAEARFALPLLCSGCHAVGIGLPSMLQQGQAII